MQYKNLKRTVPNPHRTKTGVAKQSQYEELIRKQVRWIKSSLPSTFVRIVSKMLPAKIKRKVASATKTTAKAAAAPNRYGLRERSGTD